MGTFIKQQQGEQFTVTESVRPKKRKPIKKVENSKRSKDIRTFFQKRNYEYHDNVPDGDKNVTITITID